MKITYVTLFLIILFGTFFKGLNAQSDNVSTTVKDIISTDSLELIINDCYRYTKIWYGKEFGWDFSTAGTDIYDYGQQHPQQYQYTFTTEFNSGNSRLVVLWVAFYKGINACNRAISILSGNDPEFNNPFDTKHTTKRLAEVHFLRALYNYLIIETWGENAELRTDYTIDTIGRFHPSSTTDDFYNLIESDLTISTSNLTYNDNVTPADSGRITRIGSQGMQARFYLTKAYDTGKSDYFNKAISIADSVIANNNLSLYDNYKDIWDLANNKNNKESVLTFNIQEEFSEELEDEFRKYQAPEDKPWMDREGGHHGHLMFGMQYDIVPGMKRDLENGRPYRRYFPTTYLIDSYNENVDERFDGTFKSTWFVNNLDAGRYNVTSTKMYINGMETNVYTTRYENLLGESKLFDSLLFVSSGNVATWEKGPVFVRDDTYNLHRAPKKANEGTLLFNNEGDTAISLIKGEFDDSKQLIDFDYNNFFWNIDHKFWCLDYRNMYKQDGTINDEETNDRNLGFELHKFYDNQRATATGKGSMHGERDVYVIRLPEMYLIKAEALWKTEQSGSYNTLLHLANKRAKEGVTGQELLASYGITSDDDLSLDYFLDERAREFAGEQMRWFDLKRTGTFVERMKKYAGNLEARQNVSPSFEYRPIPEAAMFTTDITDKNSSPLTIYPNPTVGTITVEHLIEGALAELFSTTGKIELIKELDFENSAIDISFLPNGIYILKITKEDNTCVVTKVVKQ